MEPQKYVLFGPAVSSCLRYRLIVRRLKSNPTSRWVARLSPTLPPLQLKLNRGIWMHMVDILSVSLAFLNKQTWLHQPHPTASANFCADRAPQAKTWSRGAGTLRRRRAQDRRELSLSMHRRDCGFLDAGIATKIVGFWMGIPQVTHQLE